MPNKIGLLVGIFLLFLKFFFFCLKDKCEWEKNYLKFSTTHGLRKNQFKCFPAPMITTWCPGWQTKFICRCHGHTVLCFWWYINILLVLQFAKGQKRETWDLLYQIMCLVSVTKFFLWLFLSDFTWLVFRQIWIIA